MNPAIVFRKSAPDKAWLIDLDHVFSVNRGEGRIHVASGVVFLGSFSAGELDVNDKGQWRMPSCGRLTDYGQDWQIPQLRPGQKSPDPYRPAHRGIFDDAAAVMLKLASLAAPVEIKNKKAKFTKPAASWNEWKFLAAWKWSAWQHFHIQSGGQTWSLEDRWNDMKDHGYPEDFRSFKTMLSRLKLKVTKSARSL